MPRYNLTPTALLIAALLCASVANAQQPDATKFDQTTYETAAAKAQADCVALWADHALDPLRDKITRGSDFGPSHGAAVGHCPLYPQKRMANVFPIKLWQVP